MKRRLLSLSLFSLLAALPFSVQAGSHEGGDGHEHTALEEEMDAMNGAWRKVRRYVSRPDMNKETLELLGTMIKHAGNSIDMKPVLLEEVPEGEKAKWLRGYQKAMRQNIKLLEQLVVALEKDDNEKAQALVGKINDHRKEGHKKYKYEKED